jgi:hypothetical protein
MVVTVMVVLVMAVMVMVVPVVGSSAHHAQHRNPSRGHEPVDQPRR